MLLNIAFITDLRKTLSHISGSVRDYGHYFKALALVGSYNELLRLVDQRTADHPEVTRVPELREMLLEHLIANASRHINVQEEQIFNSNLVGTRASLRQWQEAGYPARRTVKNYSKRLEYWKSIYNNEPMRVPAIRTKKKTPPSARYGEDIFGKKPDQQMQLYYEVRVKDRAGSIVTYEDVIRKRNLGFGGGVKNIVPFWIALNYGSSTGVQPGYPSVPGLHFIEDAERTVPANLSKYAELFSQFMLYLLDTESKAKDFSVVDEWARTYIQLEDHYINPFNTALALVFGLPF